MKLYKHTIYGLFKIDLPNSFYSPRQIQLLYSRELYSWEKKQNKKKVSIGNLQLVYGGLQSGNKEGN